MEQLASVYYDVAHPAGFTGASNLKRYVKDKLDSKKVDEWLQSQDPYTLHRQRRLKFPRNRYKVYNIDDSWQADLIDMRSLKKDNDNVNYILTVIDLFSRYAWVRPVEKKTANCIIAAFNNIFTRDNRKPINLQTDKGREFIAASVRRFLNENDIHFYVTNNPDTKAAIVERFNRTLKSRMWKYFSYANTRRYLDVLDDLVKAYNNCYHSSIRMSPASVNSTNVLSVWKTLNKINVLRKKENVLHVNDTVRISRNKHVFEKGYETNFTEEIFKVNKIIKRIPYVYQLLDLKDEIIEGFFYRHELQKVTMDDRTVFKVDKIIDERGKGTRREVFVQWLGYPSKFNSWIKASSLAKI